MSASNASGTDAQRKANKALVLAFYEKIVNQRDFEGASQYIGSYYIQHRADVADGVDGLKAFVERMKAELPSLRVVVKRVIAEGDFVVLHGHVLRVPGDRGSKHVDIFRVENGKVVEHWDIDQPIAEHSINGRGPF